MYILYICCTYGGRRRRERGIRRWDMCFQSCVEVIFMSTAEGLLHSFSHSGYDYKTTVLKTNTLKHRSLTFTNTETDPELRTQWKIKTRMPEPTLSPPEHTNMHQRKLDRKHYVIRYFQESDWVKSYFEVFQRETLLLFRASSKGTKHGKEYWTMSKYIMQQAHKILNIFKIFISVVRRKK